MCIQLCWRKTLFDSDIHYALPYLGGSKRENKTYCRSLSFSRWKREHRTQLSSIIFLWRFRGENDNNETMIMEKIQTGDWYFCIFRFKDESKDHHKVENRKLYQWKFTRHEREALHCIKNEKFKQQRFEAYCEVLSAFTVAKQFCRAIFADGIAFLVLDIESTRCFASSRTKRHHPSSWVNKFKFLGIKCRFVSFCLEYTGQAVNAELSETLSWFTEDIYKNECRLFSPSQTINTMCLSWKRNAGSLKQLFCYNLMIKKLFWLSTYRLFLGENTWNRVPISKCATRYS